jgi:hypothetical protein
MSLVRMALAVVDVENHYIVMLALVVVIVTLFEIP